MLKQARKITWCDSFLGIPSNFTRGFYRDALRRFAPVFGFELKRIRGGLTGKRIYINDTSYIYIASDD